MKMKTGDVLVYRDSETSVRYGTGIVMSVTTDEYSILWSMRGLTKYKRSILDRKLEEIFQPGEKEADIPKQRHLRLGSSKLGVPFNESYDRVKVELLCKRLKTSGTRKAIDVAEGLTAELFTKKLALRGAAKNVLLQLAELSIPHGSGGYVEAQNLSKELFFGYVLQKSDFVVADLEK